MLADASSAEPPGPARDSVATPDGRPGGRWRRTASAAGAIAAGMPAAAAGHEHSAGHGEEETPRATPAESRSHGDVPVIPDVAGPLEVDLPLLAKLVAAGAALVVDARDASEYAAGHIPGAVNVPFDDAYRNPGRLEALEARGRPIVVYCSGGTCESSRMLAEMLVRDHGRRRVLVFEAGFPGWAGSGQPVSRAGP